VATIYTAVKSKEYDEGLPTEERTLKKTLLKTIGSVQGKTILDVGCGAGKYCIILAKKNAQVIGVDISANQIHIAKYKNNHRNARYYSGDARTLDFVKSRSIDIGLMTFVIPDVSTSNKLAQIIHEVHRVMKSNGRLLLAVLHPFYLLNNTASSADYFDFKNYFKEGSRYTATAKLYNGKTMQFDETHYSLTEVSRLLLKNNFRIRRLIETPTAREIGIDKPIYLIIEAEPR